MEDVRWRPKLCSRKECCFLGEWPEKASGGVGAGCVGTWSPLDYADQDSKAVVNTDMSWLLKAWWDPIVMSLDHMTKHALS